MAAMRGFAAALHPLTLLLEALTDWPAPQYQQHDANRLTAIMLRLFAAVLFALELPCAESLAAETSSASQFHPVKCCDKQACRRTG